MAFLALLLSVILLFVLLVFAFLQHPKFGKKPKGQRLKRITSATNYGKGQFQNISHTPNLAEDARMTNVLFDFFFASNRRRKPSRKLPSSKTDLKALSPEENVLIWFGHSSYFIQLDGLKLLVDPVFSGSASPIAATTRSFKGSDIYVISDFPEIDILVITHDHWDHLDQKTVKALFPKVKIIITSLGVGAHLEFWGCPKEKIHELNWHEHLEIKPGFRIDCTPARHFSGRGLKRNQTLWSSFVLKSPSKKIFLGGDSGYDVHFKSIGALHGPFDLAILECGQYNNAWKYIHLLPEEEMKAASDLGAKAVLPVHWGKFSLALHDWDEPINRICESAETAGMPLLTPMIGQTVYLDGRQEFSKWWKDFD